MFGSQCFIKTFSIYLFSLVDFRIVFIDLNNVSFRRMVWYFHVFFSTLNRNQNMELLKQLHTQLQ